ncbi:single-stranded-DNA-specific exonuclease RecJ [Desulfobacterota bacterium AH_259_B03_O07]|nr:single-stranded-DNA-specific exonuclease RecJ [Desulfobacterota bacterium AH_259_B03_O07]
MKNNWVIEKGNPKLSEKISKKLGISPVTALVLINRGIKNEVEAEQFLKCSLFDLPSPYLMKDMEKAVDRIKNALVKEEKIAIFGDYDVDGVTSTALLFTFLNNLGINVTYYNPDRIKEGYGINIEAVKGLKTEGASLIISVDCGITAYEEVKEAKNLGVDFIITDHHKPPEILPDAIAILNPNQDGCNYPSKEITGVGVIFNLVIALRRSLRDSGYFKNKEPNLADYLDLVALGTVADCASLKDVNRIFVKQGIKRLSTPKRLGMQALKEASSIPGDVNAYDIGFKLGPRVNASGRLNSAGIAVELFISEEMERARELAERLNNENSKRQKMEGDILNEAVSHIETNPNVLNSNSIVLSSRDWHQGIVGIVASKITERYQKPAVIISVQENGIGKGSARSVEGINIYDVLSECTDLFEEFGGHELAAGITIKQENIDEFRIRLDKIISESDVNYYSKLRIDGFLDLSDINESLVSELIDLAPFGIGNPEPVFVSRSVDVASQRILKDKHLSLNLKQKKRVFNAIFFNINNQVKVPKQIDIVFTPEFNIWNGKKSIQLRIKDINW